MAVAVEKAQQLPHWAWSRGPEISPGHFFRESNSVGREGTTSEGFGSAAAFTDSWTETGAADKRMVLKGLGFPIASLGTDEVALRVQGCPARRVSTSSPSKPSLLSEGDHRTTTRKTMIAITRIGKKEPHITKVKIIFE
ncbi:hypothetical protein [Brazilian marseillevirus]|uniref:hypothetical protein n=1 Tax=Brazilian marseillevirus TaxID=1813599 RepID=UPI0007851E85|nr:hypothetical protein A3303_gp337 [Brazilian marseillevirus]AMQ10845.1 hypothetical protein [Brazilian marseillevirus]